MYIFDLQQTFNDRECKTYPKTYISVKVNGPLLHTFTNTELKKGYALRSLVPFLSAQYFQAKG